MKKKNVNKNRTDFQKGKNNCKFGFTLISGKDERLFYSQSFYYSKSFIVGLSYA